MLMVPKITSGMTVADINNNNIFASNGKRTPRRFLSDEFSIKPVYDLPAICHMETGAINMLQAYLRTQPLFGYAYLINPE